MTIDVRICWSFINNNKTNAECCREKPFECGYLEDKEEDERIVLE
jgi:hypothetical protein